MSDLPRVSTILRVLEDSYSGVPQASLDAAAERGESLHRLCLSYLASVGGMCEAPQRIPQEYAPAYLAFVRWVEMNEVSPIAIEQQSESTKYQFTGTPDALVAFSPQHVPLLLDLKFTASILRINNVQVIAYWILDLYKDAQRAMLLHIKPLTGELKAHSIKKSPRDLAAFLNALSIWRWRQS